ncbi:MAG: hypothetical protein HYZ28_04580 [Myxococcales bacterium]|nr:hypothetical protein [Myxococcales bacterium]
MRVALTSGALCALLGLACSRDRDRAGADDEREMEMPGMRAGMPQGEEPLRAACVGLEELERELEQTRSELERLRGELEPVLQAGPRQPAAAPPEERAASLDAELVDDLRSICARLPSERGTGGAGRRGEVPSESGALPMKSRGAELAKLQREMSALDRELGTLSRDAATLSVGPPLAFAGTLTSVSRRWVSVRDDRGSLYRLRLTRATEALRQGERVPLGELREGARVRAAVVLETGELVARTLEVLARERMR